MGSFNNIKSKKEQSNKSKKQKKKKKKSGKNKQNNRYDKNGYGEYEDPRYQQPELSGPQWRTSQRISQTWPEAKIENILPKMVTELNLTRFDPSDNKQRIQILEFI